MTKRGPGVREQGEYCVELGESTPYVHALIRDGYVMEYLSPADRVSSLLREMESVLRSQVWSWGVPYQLRDHDWPTLLRERVGISTPWWAVPQRLCRTHGDCTTSNAMRRGLLLVIGDPIPPRPHAPRCAEADMGRLLQSALGWECAAYGEPHVLWDAPDFWYEPEMRRRALFWCGVIAVRIRRDWSERCPEQLTEELKFWLSRVEEECFAKAGL